MAKVLIKIEDVNNVANACRQVADLFEQGYTNGVLGCSNDSWTITDYDEGNGDLE